MFSDIFSTFMIGTFGVLFAYFIIGLLFAILIAIVFGGYKVYKIGDKKKDDDLKQALKIIGYIIMAIGGIPLFIYFLPIFFQGFFYGIGRIAAEGIIDELF
jgi:hypothetical protein